MTINGYRYCHQWLDPSAQVVFIESIIQGTDLLKERLNPSVGSIHPENDSILQLQTSPLNGITLVKVSSHRWQVSIYQQKDFGDLGKGENYLCQNRLITFSDTVQSRLVLPVFQLKANGSSAYVSVDMSKIHALALYFEEVAINGIPLEFILG